MRVPGISKSWLKRSTTTAFYCHLSADARNRVPVIYSPDMLEHIDDNRRGHCCTCAALSRFRGLKASARRSIQCHDAAASANVIAIDSPTYAAIGNDG